MKGRIVALLILFIFPTWAMTAYLEEGDTAGSPNPMIPPPPPPPHGLNVCDAGDAMNRFAGVVRVGEPLYFGGAVAVPILVADPWPGVDGAGRAMRARDLVVREADGGSVPELLADNHGRRWVFLASGEILLGGKQNRIVAYDYLLSPRSGPHRVPVYCGEQGRWTEPVGAFKSSGQRAPQALQRRIAEGATQNDVWGAIDENLAAGRAENATRDLHRLYDSDRADEIARCVRRREPDWPRDAIGAVMVVNGTAVSVEWFANARMFRDQVEGVMVAMALDGASGGAMRCEAVAPGPNGVETARSIARSTLDALARTASYMPSDRAGDGCGVRVTGPMGLVGQGMLHGGDWVHLGVHLQGPAMPPIRVE